MNMDQGWTIATARWRTYDKVTGSPSRCWSDSGIPRTLRTNGGPRTAGDEPIEDEQNHGPDDGHHETRRFTLPIPAYRPTEKPAEERPDDPEPRGDHESRWVTSWHQEARDHSDDQPENDPPQNAPKSTSFWAGSLLSGPPEFY